jgi:hypothetical protein
MTGKGDTITASKPVTQAKKKFFSVETSWSQFSPHILPNLVFPPHHNYSVSLLKSMTPTQILHPTTALLTST